MTFSTFRLLEADKKLCKGLTPTHSRSGSTAGPVNPSPVFGHSRKGSSTSNVSENSSGQGQLNDEESNLTPFPSYSFLTPLQQIAF